MARGIAAVVTVLALVCLAVGASPAAPSVGDLIEQLRNESPFVRVQAAAGLGNLGFGGRAAVADLARALHDPSGNVRRRAAQALAQIGRPAIPALLKALRDPDDDVRGHAAKALAWIGPEASGAVPALLSALHDRSESVRAAAIVALGEIGPDAAEAAPELARCCGSSSEAIQELALRALTSIGPEATLRVAEVLRTSDSVPLKLNTLKVLAVYGTAAKEAVPALRDALKDTDPRVRAAAGNTLGQMRSAAKDAIPDLLDALQDTKVKVQIEAANALVILSGEGIPGLLEKVRAADRKGRWAEPLIQNQFGGAHEAVEKLLVQLKDRDATLRAQAAVALGELGHMAKAAINALTDALKDEDRLVRASAAVALAKIRGKQLAALEDGMVADIRAAIRVPRRDPAQVRAALNNPAVQVPIRRFLQLFILATTGRCEGKALEGLSVTVAQLGPEAILALADAVVVVNRYNIGFC
jgi:HEAT repeat protein